MPKRLAKTFGTRPGDYLGGAPMVRTQWGPGAPIRTMPADTPSAQPLIRRQDADAWRRRITSFPSVQRDYMTNVMAELQRRYDQPAGYDPFTQRLRTQLPYYGSNPNLQARSAAPFTLGTGVVPQDVFTPGTGVVPQSDGRQAYQQPAGAYGSDSGDTDSFSQRLIRAVKAQGNF